MFGKALGQLQDPDNRASAQIILAQLELLFTQYGRNQDVNTAKKIINLLKRLRKIFEKENLENVCKIIDQVKKRLMQEIADMMYDNHKKLSEAMMHKTELISRKSQEEQGMKATDAFEHIVPKLTPQAQEEKKHNETLKDAISLAKENALKSVASIAVLPRVNENQNMSESFSKLRTELQEFSKELSNTHT